MNFLRRIGNLPIQKGRYEPLCTHTDDIPELVMELTSPNGKIVLESTSQGEGHVPWAAYIGNHSYVIEIPEPDRALAVLEGHMKGHRLKELKKEFQRRRDSEV